MFQGLTGASTSNGSSSHQSRRLDAWTPLSPLGESGQEWGGKIHYHLALPSVMCYREAVHRRGSKDWPETKRTFCQASATFALILGGFCPCGDFCWRDGGWWRPVLRTGSASFTSVMMYLTCMCAELLQLCPTLCDTMDHNLSDSSVHGILQARILGWVTMHSSRGSSQPRDQTCFLCLL